MPGRGKTGNFYYMNRNACKPCTRKDVSLCANACGVPDYACRYASLFEMREVSQRASGKMEPTCGPHNPNRYGLAQTPHTGAHPIPYFLDRGLVAERTRY